MIYEYNSEQEIIENRGIDFFKMILEHIGEEAGKQQVEFYIKNNTPLYSARCVIVMSYRMENKAGTYKEEKNVCIDTHWLHVSNGLVAATIFKIVVYDKEDMIPDVVMDMYNELKNSEHARV